MNRRVISLILILSVFIFCGNVSYAQEKDTSFSYAYIDSIDFIMDLYSGLQQKIEGSNIASKENIAKVLIANHPSGYRFINTLLNQPSEIIPEFVKLKNNKNYSEIITDFEKFKTEIKSVISAKYGDEESFYEKQKNLLKKLKSIKTKELGKSVNLYIYLDSLNIVVDFIDLVNKKCINSECKSDDILVGIAPKHVFGLGFVDDLDSFLEKAPFTVEDMGKANHKKINDAIKSFQEALKKSLKNN